MLEPLRAAIAETLDGNPADLSVKQLALRLGKALPTVYSWAAPGEDQRAPTVEALVQLTLIAADPRPLDALCRLAGGAFTPLPPRGPVNAALLKTIKETAEAIAATAEALKDGKLTERERRQVRREALEAAEACLQLAASVEAPK